MGPSDSPSEPLGSLGRFIASLGCQVSAQRCGLPAGKSAPPRPGPAPAPPRGRCHRPFPGPFPARQPRAARRPLAPAVTRRRSRGKASGGRRSHRRLGGPAVLRRLGHRALGGLGQVPLEAPRGSQGSPSVTSSPGTLPIGGGAAQRCPGFCEGRPRRLLPSGVVGAADTSGLVRLVRVAVA